MTVADHKLVGEVGFAAWSASDAFEDSYLDLEVIARVKLRYFEQMKEVRRALIKELNSNISYLILLAIVTVTTTLLLFS
ncbi:hypothetical protein [Rhizobium terrae]|uniref:hypothetical protein n=1 Tax=Rhizobium terrae TaxID=2171756 RepID=UPI001D02FB41|nr:hypothetical protein [Rhizobium terrae]